MASRTNRRNNTKTPKAQLEKRKQYREQIKRRKDKTKGA